MNLKTAKTICNRQGIKMHVTVPVICPHCNRKSMILDVTKNNAICIYCKNEYKTIEELDRLEEERWRSKHKNSIKEMEIKSRRWSNE